MEHNGPVLRPRCIWPGRARTQTPFNSIELFEFLIAMLLSRSSGMCQHAGGPTVTTSVLPYLHHGRRKAAGSTKMYPTTERTVRHHIPEDHNLKTGGLGSSRNEDCGSMSTGTRTHNFARPMTKCAIATGTHISQHVYHTDQTVFIQNMQVRQHFQQYMTLDIMYGTGSSHSVQPSITKQLQYVRTLLKGSTQRFISRWNRE